ncbi:MAG: acyl-CoA dehydrogenase, partial [Actinomycetota bacterium]
MDFAFDAVTADYRDRLLAFMDEHVYPQEATYYAQVAELEDYWAWTRTPILLELQAKARAAGLWNLFLPGDLGAGLTN